MIPRINRRETITLLCGAAAAWPLAARAQQGNRVRRIGVLMAGDENNPGQKTIVSAFTQALAGLGWTDGRSVRMDLRWGRTDINRLPALAQELVGLQPDVIARGGTPATVAVQRETRTIPIVFASLDDPVASGIVPRLNQPGGNVTGFAACCARAASGHAAAPPRSVMNSRRRSRGRGRELPRAPPHRSVRAAFPHTAPTSGV